MCKDTKIKLHRTFRLLLFIKFNTEIFSFPLVLCKKVYLCSTFLIIKNEELRTNNKQKEKNL
jgi:hypothetical protein